MNSLKSQLVEKGIVSRKQVNQMEEDVRRARTRGRLMEEKRRKLAHNQEVRGASSILLER